jgi:hypothetical protein
LENAPFPYYGKYADTADDFFDFRDPDTGRKFHTNRYGQRYEEKDHYDDSTVLFHVPPGFDPNKHFIIAVYFHGNQTDARTFFRRYELAAQIDAASLQTVLVLPQLAKNALDSSPGKLFRAGGFKAFLTEAEDVLAARLGPAAENRIRRAPVVLAAFSGGYKAAAYVLDRDGVGQRIKGVLLLDALFEDEDKFVSWLNGRGRDGLFVSLYNENKGCREQNRRVAEAIAGLGISYRIGWPEAGTGKGIFFAPVRVPHLEIPLQGPPDSPLTGFLNALGR